MIHDRMPVLLPKSEWSQWLNPATSSEQVSELLDPEGEAQLRVGSLDAFPVSRMVNAVRNNGPDLVEPIQEEAEGLW
jgi:putative SOS response-associated peptidase YedK